MSINSDDVSKFGWDFSRGKDVQFIILENEPSRDTLHRA